MTRKHYVMLAEQIRLALMEAMAETTNYQEERTAGDAIHKTATNIADALGKDNPRFDRNRFLKAAGVI